MSELRDLLQTVDEQRKDIDKLVNSILTLSDKNIVLNLEIADVRKEITVVRKEAIEFQESIAQIIKDMGFDVKRLARDRSCRI